MHLRRLSLTAALSFAFVLGGFVVPMHASAALPFTEKQIQSVVDLLYTYGSDQKTISNVTAAMQNGETGAPAAIVVTAPNGGEKWEGGIMNTVTWAPYNYNPDINPSRDVTAYLEKANPKGSAEPFTTLGKVQESGKASIHWQTGELNSATGVSFAPPGQYYIRVVNNVTGEWDRSDKPFTILPRSIDMKINGSDSHVILSNFNQDITVSWVGSGVSGCQLYGMKDISSSKIQPIRGSVTGKIAYSEVNGGFAYGVYIKCSKIQDGYPFEVGDSAHVTVIEAVNRPAFLQVVSPNGGDSLWVDSSQNILWNQTGLKSLSVALYKNDQWLLWINKNVSEQQREQGFLDWTPSALKELVGATTLGKIFKIYVTGEKADGSGYLDDKSDAPFEFSKPSAETLGRYEAYLEGNLLIAIDQTKQSDALTNCKLNAAKNSSKAFYCTWNGVEIYSTKNAKGALSITVGASPASKTILPGTVVLFTTLHMDAVASQEDIQVTSMPLRLSYTSAATQLTSCQVFDGATPLNTGANVVNPTGADSSFKFNTPLVITKGTTKSIVIKCKVSTTATGSFAWGISNGAGTVTRAIPSKTDVVEKVTLGMGALMTVDKEKMSTATPGGAVLGVQTGDLSLGDLLGQLDATLRELDATLAAASR